MDFRSQLSAFQKKSSDSSSNRGNGGDNGHGNSNYSSNRGDRGGRGNYGGNSSFYGGRGNSRYDYPNRGRDDDRYGGDRRRHRPAEWSQDSNYRHGPSTNRRRFHPPQHGYGSSDHGHGYGHGPPPSHDGLDELRNLGYRIPRGFPRAPTAEEKAKKSKHVALLVIFIDDLPFEEIWKGWMETLSSSLDESVDDFFVSVLCHAKFPKKVTSEWMRQRLLTFGPKQGRGNSFMDPVYLTREPEWGSVEITRAMLDLLQNGLKIGNDAVPKCEDKRFCPSRFLARSPPSFDGSSIPPVDQFLYVSESCMPVVTAPEFFKKISDSTVSWVNARHRTEEDTPKNKYEDDQFAGINRRIPGQYRWKGDQWVLLSRKHASSIIGMDRPFKPAKHQLWQSFRHINASDEMFFPTALALLGELRYTKDGNDTQKGRLRDEESSSTQTGEGGLSAASSPKNAVGQTQSHSEANPSAESSPPMKNQQIVLTPVTFTDWTEGMKNPALFSKGATDLKRVGKLARDRGCLVARKFATHVSIPGIPLEEQKITGVISLEEWATVIKEIQSCEKESASEQEDKPAVVAPPAEVNQAAKTTEDDDAEDVDANNSDGDGIAESTPVESGNAVDKEEEDDDDNDEGETQLE